MRPMSYREALEEISAMGDACRNGRGACVGFKAAAQTARQALTTGGRTMHLRPENDEGLFVLFDADGNVARTGFLEIDEDDVVRFVDDRTPPVVNDDPAGP